MENKITMLVNNVVTSSKEFFESNFEELPMEVMFLLHYEEGTAIIRYTNNQMPSLTPETKDAWMEQLKLVAQLSKNSTIKGVGATAKMLEGFKGICKLFYNA